MQTNDLSAAIVGAAKENMFDVFVELASFPQFKQKGCLGHEMVHVC